MPTSNKRQMLANLYDNAKVIEGLMGRAVCEALCEHKHAGNPIAVWEEGKVKWIAAEDIVIPTDSEDDPH